MTDHDTPRHEPGRPPVRIGDAERERMIAALQEHMGAGRLDIGEFERRVEHATAAVYDRDLEGLLDDLPPVEPDRDRDTTGPRGRPRTEDDRRGATDGRRRSRPGPYGVPPFGLAGVPPVLLLVGAVALVVVTHGWVLFPLLFIAVFAGRGGCWPRGGRGHRHGHDTRARSDARPDWWAHGHDRATDEDAWEERAPTRPTWPGRYDPIGDEPSGRTD